MIEAYAGCLVLPLYPLTLAHCPSLLQKTMSILSKAEHCLISTRHPGQDYGVEHSFLVRGSWSVLRGILAISKEEDENWGVD